MRSLPKDFDWKSYANTTTIPELSNFNLNILTPHKEKLLSA